MNGDCVITNLIVLDILILRVLSVRSLVQFLIASVDLESMLSLEQLWGEKLSVLVDLYQALSEDISVLKAVFTDYSCSSICDIDLLFRMENLD